MKIDQCFRQNTMTLDEFRQSLAATEPPAGLSLALAGLVSPATVRNTELECRELQSPFPCRNAKKNSWKKYARRPVAGGML